MKIEAHKIEEVKRPEAAEESRLSRMLKKSAGWPLDIDYYLYKCKPPICTYDCKRESDSNIRRASCLRRSTDEGYTEYRHVFCKRIDCKTCAPRVVELRMQGIEKAILDHGLTTFVTLTYYRANPSLMKKQRTTFLKKLRIILGRDTSYIWVIGGDKRDSLHFHMLLNRTISKNKLRQLWILCGGGQQVDVQTFPTQDSGNIACYMIRNWLQSFQSGYSSNNARRIGNSKNIKLKLETQRKEKSNWTYDPYLSTSSVRRWGGYDPHMTSTGDHPAYITYQHGKDMYGNTKVSITDAPASLAIPHGAKFVAPKRSAGSIGGPQNPSPAVRPKDLVNPVSKEDK
jgi:hypothetical protein